MAKKALLDVLEQTIGKYVRNLDAESLNVAVWSGKIELHSLELDIDAVNAELDRQAAIAPNLAIPFRVCAGKFEKFQVDVPWAHLMSRPVILRAQGLTVQVEAKDRTESMDPLYKTEQSEKERANRLQKQRVKAIQRADDFRLKSNALAKLAEQDLSTAQPEAAATAAQQNQSSFGSRLVRRIIENIQMEVSDVHISLVDQESSAGVLLESLQLVTTDETGKRAFVDRTAATTGTSGDLQKAFLHKALEITGFGFYLDEVGPRKRPLSSISEAVSQSDLSDHHYILAPLSLNAKLRQADSNVCVDFPKYTLESQLSSLAVLLSKAQVETAFKIAQKLQPATDASRPLFPEYRPLYRVTQATSKEWWHYAYRCIGRLSGRTLWREFFQAFQARKRYIGLYKRKQHANKCPWLTTLSENEAAELEKIERDRTVSMEGLMLWRNIADAQMEKEQEKHTATKKQKKTTNLFTSIFGGSSSKSQDRSGAQVTEKEDEAPPISLTTQELKELEAATMAAEDDAELSGKLCDVQFTLGSFRVHLTSYNLQQLAALEMGAVSTNFNANVDGSFAFDFRLSSLQIHDKATPNSLFPTILKNQQAPKTGKAPEKGDAAFSIHLDKNAAGDQNLQVVLRTFEMIASPVLLTELKRFCSVQNIAVANSSGQKNNNNPILAQSLSGSVDLFYDATEGVQGPSSLRLDPSQTTVTTNDRYQTRDKALMTDFSLALVDAWKTKTEKRSALAIDLDLQAPILVLPENCIDGRANVLVFDFGHLRLHYGGSGSFLDTQQWFQDNPLDGDASKMPLLDHGSLEISSLTFLIGKANYWRRLVAKLESSSCISGDEAVLDPISVTVDFAIEAHRQDPRICAFAVIPSIALGLSLGQLLRIMTVGNTWKKLQSDVFSTAEDNATSGMVTEHTLAFVRTRSRTTSFDTATTEEQQLPRLHRHEASKSLSEKPSSPFPRLYVHAQLKRLSLSILTDKGPVMEAHLVSVTSSMTSLSDGSSTSRLSMGWFWIVDRLENKFARKQRLLAHSALPFSASSKERDHNHDILTELERLGVFAENKNVLSSDLADITFEQAGEKFSSAIKDEISAEAEFGTVLHAKFSSLFVNWNPLAIKVITSELEKFQRNVKANLAAEAPLIVSAANPTAGASVERASMSTTEPNGTSFLLKVELQRFRLCLHSAKDDLPLFSLTMSGTEVSRLSYDDENRETSLILGDISLVSPSEGRTDSLYQTVLGLSPGQTDSLLKVKFYEGSDRIRKLSIEGADGIEAYGDVELSPMRLVYIHSQVLALVEYGTAGILGALAAQAATTAAAAAAELALASASKKRFHVEATGLEILLPQAAYRKRFFSINSGTLKVDYETMADTSSKADVRLSGFELRNPDGVLLQEGPIGMAVGVIMPPEHLGSKDDQAIRAFINMAKAEFIIPQKDYSQILATLSENIGDANLYLRDDSTSSESIDATGDAIGTGEGEVELTHAGIEMVDDPRRIYVSVDIGVMSLELNFGGIDDPLVRLAAVDASIKHHMYPDRDRTSSTITLRNLACDDLRNRTITRQYRSLVYQSKGQKESQGPEDAFSILYERRGSLATSLDVSVGSPHLVFIPDAIADILSYLEGDPHVGVPMQIESTTSEKNAFDEPAEEQLQDDTSEQTSHALPSTTFLSLKTSRCSVIFVDLGTDAVLQAHAALSSSQVVSVAETIVFKGKFEANVKLTNASVSKELIGVDVQLHGDELESYTAFGKGLDSALQVIEPTKLSLFFRQKRKQDQPSCTEIDVRCAAMEPIDITLSMRNVALVNAIMTSISTCFDRAEEESPEPASFGIDDARKIEQLASALDADDTDQSSHSRPPSMHSASASFAESDRNVNDPASKTISVHLTAPAAKATVINDLQGLDEPLFRVTARNAVSNARLWEMQSLKGDSLPYKAFDFNANVSMLADFFDHTTNAWKQLLVKPWEITWKGHRGPSERYKSSRPSTTIDVECFPCYLSFSEQFLMGLASANQMWTVYSRATDSASIEAPKSKSLRRSLAASAARKFIVSLPYAVENHTGVNAEFAIGNKAGDRRFCASGSLEYFRFEPPRGKGSAGKRMYGQDVSFDKKILLAIGGSLVQIGDIDSLAGAPKRSYTLENGDIIMSQVVREGKTTVIHLYSGIEIHNNSSVPFSVSFVGKDDTQSLGVCGGLSPNLKPSPLMRGDGNAQKMSRHFGIPANLLKNFWLNWSKESSSKLCLILSPNLSRSCPLKGVLEIGVDLRMLSLEGGVSAKQRFDVTCRPSDSGDSRDQDRDPFVCKVSLIIKLVDGRLPYVQVVLEPRARIENLLPVAISIRSPMPHLFGNAVEPETYELQPESSLEIFTPGPSIAVVMKFTDLPVGGSATSWIDGGWIDLPLVTEFRLFDPLRCVFPFTRREHETGTLPGYSGVEAFISQGSSNLLENTFERAAKDHTGFGLSEPRREVEMSFSSSDDDFHKFYITTCFYAVDHTGDILFEQLCAPPKEDFRKSLAERRRGSTSQLAGASLSAFATPHHAGRVSILPGSKPIRLLHLTMEGDEGTRRSAPFLVDSIMIGDGGLDSTPLMWEDGSESGLFAYRQLVSSHQSEIHVVPEYIVFNGSKRESVRVRQPGGLESLILPGAIAPLRTPSKTTTVISVECISSGGRTSPMRVDSLGLRVAIVKSADGTPMGSIAIQTVVGGLDSRLVVKLGALKYGSTDSNDNSSSSALLESDFIRFRVQWSELQLSMYEARPVSGKETAFLESVMDHIGRRQVQGETWVGARENNAAASSAAGSVAAGPVCSILLHRFTVDWQRVFKEDASAKQLAFRSPERSQLSVIVNSIMIKDDTPNSPYPVVFNSSTNANFWDLCVRFKGPLTAELVKVDLFDLKLAHGNNASERIIVKTSEEFVWKFLDLADRILTAASEFAGVNMELEWDEEHDGYKVVIRDKASYIETTGRYSPPKSDTLYDINRARVSPFTIVVSFKRKPESHRYALKRGVRGANLMNYFTTQLKFQINGAELKFARYEAHNVKGPPDRLIELLSTVYFSRAKMKMLTIISAASFQDWKTLASRDEGDDAFVEGDILRATGNLAGKTANLFLRKAGRGLGQGVSAATGAIGDGIESGTSAIGLKPVGAGVNSVVSGVGDGVAHTLTGVGKGSGQVLRGAGKGVGHVFGGVTGGALQVTKGIGKGITKGDGKAVVSGITEGVTSIGTGVGQGVESVVTGTAQGVLSMGQGLFSGAKSLGHGIGGAFTGKKASRRRKPGSGDGR